MTSLEDMLRAHRRQKKRASDARRLLRKLEALWASGDTAAAGELLMRWREVLDPFGDGRYDEKGGNDDGERA